MGTGGLAILPALIALGIPCPAPGQEEATAVLRGQVRLGDGIAASGTVLLHHVSRDVAGELDSIPVGPDGDFRFELPSVPDPGAQDVYFAAIRYQGILYFGPAISEAIQLDSLYVIEVYDTLAAGPEGEAFPIAVRNVFLEPEGAGWRVTDLIQVRNERDRTYVAPDDGYVWSYPLPEGARNFEVGQGDFGANAAELVGTTVQVAAPIPPGERVFVFRYSVETSELSLPLAGLVERAELLIREPAPPLEVTGLDPAAPVEMEPGTTYRRYLATGLTAPSIDIRRGESSGLVPVQWLAVLLAVILGGVGVLVMRREGERRPKPIPASAGAPRQAVLLEIARLDQQFEALESPSADEEAEYRRRRQALKERLLEPR